MAGSQGTGDEYGAPPDILVGPFHHFLFKLGMLGLFPIRGCRMLGVTVISGSQLLVAVTGQKGTATSPTRLPTRFVLLLMASLALASHLVFGTCVTLVASLTLTACPALTAHPALCALSAFAACLVQFPLSVVFASGP